MQGTETLMADCDVAVRCFPGGMQDQRPDQRHYVPELLKYALKRVQMEVCTTWQHRTVRSDDVKSKLSFGSVCLNPGREALHRIEINISHLRKSCKRKKYTLWPFQEKLSATRLNHNI